MAIIGRGARMSSREIRQRVAIADTQPPSVEPKGSATMRFNCGPTMQERFQRKLKWHPWFAWFPVRLMDTNQCVWLEVVERQLTGGYSGYYYEKRELASKEPT